MTETDKLYYKEMLAKGRLIPFIKNNELIGFVSFFITNNPEKYINRNNSWSVEEDDPETGTVFLIDQVWSNRRTHSDSLGVWKKLVNFVKLNYPQVEKIRWNRWKNDRLYIFNKEIKKEKEKCPH